MENATSALVDEEFPSIVSNKTILCKMAAKALYSKNQMTQETEKTLKEGTIQVLFLCTINLVVFIADISHMNKSPSCAILTSFSSETEIKSLSRLPSGHSSWNSGLVKRIYLVSKTCSIQSRILHPPPKSLQKVYDKCFEQT